MAVEASVANTESNQSKKHMFCDQPDHLLPALLNYYDQYDQISNYNKVTIHAKKLTQC